MLVRVYLDFSYTLANNVGIRHVAYIPVDYKQEIASFSFPEWALSLTAVQGGS